MSDFRQKYNKILVLDFEQTCWEGDPPPGEYMEVIEIGVCLISTHNLEISKPRRIFVKPSHSKVSEFCTKLTTITQEQIDTKGMSLVQAGEILLNEYKIDTVMYAGWGRDDDDIDSLLWLKPQGSYINIASLYGLATNTQSSVSLDNAISQLGLEFQGIRHTGGADAYNAAKVLVRMLDKLRTYMFV
jgi:inhibitor of KinA sporulation pathway (predicted exonuclease)